MYISLISLYKQGYNELDERQVCRMITVHIRKQLGETLVEANIQLPDIGITALYGHSGAGKTSIINMIAGLITPDEGLIRMKEKLFFDSKKKINLPPEKRHAGYIFQDKRLFNFISVQRNLLFSGKTDATSPLFKSIISLLGLTKLLHRKPAQLSGGEAQRVAIGRALLSKPQLLLLDEPMSFLDHQLHEQLMNYLEQIPKKFGIPIILVTHSLEEIERLADHIFLIENGHVSQTRHSLINHTFIAQPILA
ncbi:MAG: Vitamin B12 import ATP-binding protein BtuD [Candidatus Celerinatantimonas neptuna]|nr:MAG: Vitamin B12 import ATP-binding protein BtuD [Candidatus Celerinatantimonas neptuna]